MLDKKTTTDDSINRSCAPVLFLVFARPDTTARVFEQIRASKPSQLFVAADGPRSDRPGEWERCLATRKIVDEGVDWPCDVQKLYREKNLGCRRAVAGAIDWFFEQVPEGIILEDDTLPHQDFFSYCTTLLERYRDDSRVMHIGGFNAASGRMKVRGGCWFSHHAWIWGWATWRRAWKLYDRDMSTWDERFKVLSSTFASGWEQAFWLAAWRECREDPKKADTWDFPWMYTVRSLKGHSVLPTGNLIKNIGFNSFATHTQSTSHLNNYSFLTSSIDLPATAIVSKYRDEKITRSYASCGCGFTSEVASMLRIAKRLVNQNALRMHNP